MIAAVRNIFVVSALSAAGACHAQDYASDVKQCIVKSATQQDKQDLVRWVFIAMAAHPATRDIATVAPAKHTEVTKRATQVFERLLTSDCTKEVSMAVRYSGTDSIGKAFGALGGLAFQDLMTYPNVQKSMSELINGLDPKSMDRVGHYKL